MARDDPYATLKAYGSAPAANASYAAGETTPAAPVPLPPATPQKGVTLPPVGHTDIELPAPAPAAPEPDFSMLSPAQRAQIQTQQQALAAPDYATATTTSTQTTTRSGRPMDKPWLAKQGQLYQEQREVTAQEAASKVKEAKETEAVTAQTLEKMAAKSTELSKERARIQEQITAREERIDAATKAVAKAKVDPKHYWNNLETSDKVMHGMAIALGGFLKGWTHGRMGNTALEMYNRAVERDLQAQRRKIMQQKEGIRGDENMLAHYYKDLGSLTDAEVAYRNTMNANMRMQLKKIQMSNAPERIRVNAKRIELGLEAQAAREQHEERLASFSQTVTTRNVQTRRVPLQPVSPKQVANLDAPPDAIIQQMYNANVFRAHVDQFWHEFKKLKLPTTVTKWTGEGADRVDKLQQRVSESLSRKLVGTGASTQMIQSFKTHIARPFSTNEDVRKRLMGLLHETDDEQASRLNLYGKKYNLMPYYKDEAQRRRRQRVLYGMKYAPMRLQRPVYAGKQRKKQ